MLLWIIPPKYTDAARLAGARRRKERKTFVQQVLLQNSGALSTPAKRAFSNDELRAALDNWRCHILDWLGREMLEAAEDQRDAQDDLAIAHRSRGEVADDVVNYLWDKLNEKSILLCRLARVFHRIEEMGPPKLLLLFQRTNKVKTYPWEGEAWELPPSIF